MPEQADAFRLFVSAYHPDVLRQPGPDPVLDAGERLRQAMTWNVFRTLEQIAPAFWMRPLIAALGRLSDDFASAPHVCQVSCWDWLDPAPAAMLRRGRRTSVRADVVIDTDDTVVTCLVPTLAELTQTMLTDSEDGGLLDLVEATSFKGGVRAAYVGVVLPPGADGHAWIARVNRRAHALHRVLSASGRGVRNAHGIGAVTWRDLHAILVDASRSSFLHAPERTLAKCTAEWMDERLIALSAREYELARS